MTRFPIGSRVRYRPTGQVGTIERPVHPDQWWVTWRDGGMVRRGLYRGVDLDSVPIASSVAPVRDQTATPPSTFDAGFPLNFDAGSSSAPDPSPDTSSSPDTTPDSGGGGFDGGGGDSGGGGASGEW